MQESDNGLNKDHNNCVECFLYLKCFFFFLNSLRNRFKHNPIPWLDSTLLLKWIPKAFPWPPRPHMIWLDPPLGSNSKQFSPGFLCTPATTTFPRCHTCTTLPLPLALESAVPDARNALSLSAHELLLFFWLPGNSSLMLLPRLG